MKVKKFRKIISLGMAVILAGTVLTGCKIKSDTPILGKIFGLGSNQIFKVNELVCSKIEYKLVFMDYVNKYKKDFGGDIDWNAKINNDLTMKEYIMDKAKADIARDEEAARKAAQADIARLAIAAAEKIIKTGDQSGKGSNE